MVLLADCHGSVVSHGSVGDHDYTGKDQSDYFLTAVHDDGTEWVGKGSEKME